MQPTWLHERLREDWEPNPTVCDTSAFHAGTKLWRLRVNFGLSRPTAATSAFRGKADEIGTITDIGQRMSAVGGKADVPATWPESPLLATSGHSIETALEHSFLS